MKKPWLVGLMTWLIAAVIFMAFTTMLMWPLEEEKESIYSLYLPEVSATPTLAERQELAYRWFHKQEAVEVKWKDFEKFKAVEFVFYDLDLDVSVGDRLSPGFELGYLGLAKDGKVYHATSGDRWASPYYVSSHTLGGDQLHLRLKRNDRMLVVYLGMAALSGVIPAMFVAPFFMLPPSSQKKTSRVV